MLGPNQQGMKRKLEDVEEVEGTLYARQRQAVLNMSMCKLNRYRQMLDPSLRRSVLICNTLRLIEREMESEGLQCSVMAAAAAASSFLPGMQNENMTLDPLPGSSSLPPPLLPLLPSLPFSQPVTSPPSSTPVAEELHPHVITVSSAVTVVQNQHVNLNPLLQSRSHHCPHSINVKASVDACPATTDYEKSLVEMDSQSGRATPFPHPDADANRPEAGALPWNEADDRLSSINWSSVLNFTSQSESDYITSCSTSTPGMFTGYPVSVSVGISSPSLSPNACSDSGVSSTGSEIFGDVDLSLYDFDLLPLSPPNMRFTPLSAEELLRSFPNNNNGSNSSNSSNAEAIPPVPNNGCFKNEFLGEDLDHIMHILVGGM